MMSNSSVQGKEVCEICGSELKPENHKDGDINLAAFCPNCENLVMGI